MGEGGVDFQSFICDEIYDPAANIFFFFYSLTTKFLTLKMITFPRM